MKLPFQTPLQMQTFVVTFRFMAVGFLVLVLAVPLFVVSCVTDERAAYRDTAVAKVASSFGRSQRLAGPVLAIPLVERYESDEGAMLEQHLFVMPERLVTRIDTSHEMRSVGIFEIPALTAQVTAEGEFAPLDVPALEARHGALRLHRAIIGFGVSDPRGMLDAKLLWNDVELRLEAGAAPVEDGVVATPANVEAGGAISLSLAVRGTKRFSAVPVGDRSAVAMQSTWPHPAYDGRFAPENYEINDAGFTASWRSMELSRGYSTMVVAPSDGFFNNKRMDVGFSVFEPMNLYVLVVRSVKYGVLFVALTLVSVLCLELSTGRRFHIVQYGVAGVGLVLFFLSLLALSEHVGFPWAYLGAAALLTGMISAYVRAATREWWLTGVAAGVLAALYGVLFTLLRLVDYALLVGVGVLLVALANLMWVTRRLTPPQESSDEAAAANEPAAS